MADMNQLAKILRNSKAVMNKVDNGDFTKGNVNPNAISESTNGAVATPPQRIPKTIEERYPNLENSKLPQAVKDAMINNPIDIPEMPSLGGNSSFEITPELMAEVNNGNHTSKQPVQNTPQPSSVNEQQIRDIVRSEMEAFMSEYFDKALVKEDVQIKVGNTIFSGSLKPLPKKKSK